MNKLPTKFMKSEVIQKRKEDKLSFSKLDTTLQNRQKKTDNKLTAGILTQSLSKQLLDECVGDAASHCFCNSLRAFYKTAYQYCEKWLSLDDPMYVNSKFIKFSRRNMLTFVVVINTVTRFPERFKIVFKVFISWMLLKRNS